MHIDTLKDFTLHSLPLTESTDPLLPPNIIATFDFINLIGWKYHTAQQKSKTRGTAEFSLQKVVEDMNEDAENEDEKIKYGVLIDDGDTVFDDEEAFKKSRDK